MGAQVSNIFPSIYMKLTKERAPGSGPPMIPEQGFNHIFSLYLSFLRIRLTSFYFTSRMKACVVAAFTGSVAV